MATDLFKNVGLNIQQVLNDKNMSQQTLANALGISKQVMSKIINGVKAINVAEITKIADILCLPVEKLLEQKAQYDSVEAFNFMGNITCESTKESIEHLKEIINELLFLDSITEER